MSGRRRNRGAAEACVLEKEAGRLVRTSVYSRRAPEYRPSLSHFSSTSFSDFVRHTILGVPISCNTSVTPSAAICGIRDQYSPKQPSNSINRYPGIESPRETNCDESSRFDQPKNDLTKTSPEENTTKNNTTPPNLGQDSVIVFDIEPGESPLLSGHSVNRHPGIESPSTAYCKESSQFYQSRNDMAKTSPELNTTKNNITPSNQGQDSVVVFDIEPGESPRSRKSKGKMMRRRQDPKQTCMPHFSDGMAKVTPPEGWWDRKGIANDVTARGPDWDHGTELGDKLITSPIKQCVSGIGGVYDFTMLEIPAVTVAQFRDDADKYRLKQIGSSHDDDVSDEFIDNMARKFWRRLGPTMEPARYGADMPGSMFMGADACGWNIDNLDSCLQLLRVDAPDGDEDVVASLPGVTSAYLYVGMWGSVFAAHSEDMNLLAINYLHAGAPKYWYAIAPEDTQRFESLASSHFGSEASSCSEFLRHKRCLLSPAVLQKAGISYSIQIQRPGDAIITFPGVYHFGFNTGFNVAESTNFAVPEWITFGRTAGICMCHPHSVRIDMNRIHTLLQQYEEAADKDTQITYTKWAKSEAKKRKEKLNTLLAIDSHKKPTSYKEGILVEVLSVAPKRSMSQASPKKRKSSPNKRKKATWRIALTVKPSLYQKATKVLCRLPSDDTDNTDEEHEKFFSGSIKEIIDGYARVHFPGANKNEDVW
eukprot:CAMPEP_0172517894 /NCGR_PEP_ID=MMETSP1066-20121228/288795_1 /TAXON_ID=671091 /ORGANISM="Coscinodiscus wailesii, Strain CCMP2513" /LENGTH=705 /DNA_ID=CAMNT_0013300105 /DNA_START=102 /DNA_END=2216 /DNA_ORIENTATION=+